MLDSLPYLQQFGTTALFLVDSSVCRWDTYVPWLSGIGLAL
jgi:hypothetical protein